MHGVLERVEVELMKALHGHVVDNPYCCNMTVAIIH